VAGGAPVGGGAGHGPDAGWRRDAFGGPGELRDQHPVGVLARWPRAGRPRRRHVGVPDGRRHEAGSARAGGRVAGARRPRGRVHAQRGCVGAQAAAGGAARGGALRVPRVRARRLP